MIDQLVIDAICMRLSAAIEALSQVDDQTRDALFGSDWPLMWGMRNRIAHGYASVDHERLWGELPDGLRALDAFAAAVAVWLPAPENS